MKQNLFITLLCLITNFAIAQNITNNQLEDELFINFPWLSSIINATNCQSGDKVELYKQFGYSFLIVDNFEARKLYFQDGTFYCQDQPNFSCLNVCNLSTPDLVWNCGEIVEPPTCEYDDPLQQDWIQEIINTPPTGSCSTNVIEMFEYLGSNYFVLSAIECDLATPDPAINILDCTGAFHCVSAGYIEDLCEYEILIAYQSGIEIWRYEPPILIDDPIFEQYTWLNSTINPDNCEEYISIKEYDFGNYAYLFIETQNGGILYFEDGISYCSSSNSFDCEMLYNLINPTYIYNCEGSVTPDFTFTICPGESVELEADSFFEILDCTCTPCPPLDPLPGPPEIEWTPPVECDSPIVLDCLNRTVSPTKTTVYTAVVEDVRVGVTGCFPEDFDPNVKTFTNTTFLVIVDDEGCEENNVCEYNDPLTDLEWLAALKNEYLYQKISTHTYNGETVFLRSIESIATGFEIYNCKGEIICDIQTFGTINTCSDFNYTETLEEVIYDSSCNTIEPLQLAWVQQIINQTPDNDCDTHSIEMFEYIGSNYFVLNPSADCTLSTPGGGFSILNCNNEVVCTTISNVTCNGAIIEAAQNAVEIWAYEEAPVEYDFTFTICPDESVEFEAAFLFEILDCTCTPCPPLDPFPGPPEIEWNPPVECNSPLPLDCLNRTVSPTETTSYTAVVEDVRVGVTDCFPEDFDPNVKTFTTTTFLVIVDETCGGYAKESPAPEINIYPNPATSIINIDLPEVKNTRSTLTLKNTNGQMLHILQLQPNMLTNQQIDLSQYSSGIYLLVYFDGKKTNVEKIIKK